MPPWREPVPSAEPEDPEPEEPEPEDPELPEPEFPEPLWPDPPEVDAEDEAPWAGAEADESEAGDEAPCEAEEAALSSPLHAVSDSESAATAATARAEFLVRLVRMEVDPRVWFRSVTSMRLPNATIVPLMICCRDAYGGPPVERSTTTAVACLAADPTRVGSAP